MSNRTRGTCRYCGKEYTRTPMVKHVLFCKEKLTVLSRNHPITFICEKCEKKTATALCMECIYDGAGFLCDDCRQDHECGEDMLSELCNSPRIGVCGYEGSYKYPD